MLDRSRLNCEADAGEERGRVGDGEEESCLTAALAVPRSLDFFATSLEYFSKSAGFCFDVCQTVFLWTSESIKAKVTE